MDDAANKPVGGKFGVRGYPTLKIFRNGVVSDYSGPRDATGIVEFLKTEKAKVRFHSSVAPHLFFGRGRGRKLRFFLSGRACFLSTHTSFFLFFVC